MDIRVDGKVALVTGGSRGIGRAIATALAESGASVMISSRKAAALEEAAASISASISASVSASVSGDVAWFAANSSDATAAAACVAATVERFGALDILVNNAATNPYLGPLIDLDAARADKIVQVNQWAVLHWTQLAHRAWMAEHGGAVVNLASIGGIGVEPAIGYYNVTKAAVIHITKHLASELGPGVRVNAIAPGLVRTDLARALWETDGSRIAARLPLRRLGEPSDIAAAVVFLASDAAGWITGATLVVDGGALVGLGLA